jgi:virginiamycin B lyase
MFNKLAKQLGLPTILLLSLLLSACGQATTTTTQSTTVPAPTATTAPNPPTVAPTVAALTPTANSVPTVAPTTAPVPTQAPTIQPTATIQAVASTATPEGQIQNSGSGPVNFKPVMQTFPVPRGSAPHDIAPAPDGTVWYTAQRTGELGRLDPKTGTTKHIKLGSGSAPHGVIVAPDGGAWVTDSGLNAMVRVDPVTEKVDRFNLPDNRPFVNLNTAAFDKNGVIWFTGQNGVYGRLNPATAKMDVYDAPRGRGPYGIVATPDGSSIYYASLAGSHIARVDIESGVATVLEPPTKGQGARRVWSDSQGRIWVSEWNSGQVSVYDPKANSWKEWKLPGNRPQTYAVYVDEQDMVWLSDFGANALVRFDPKTEKFEVFPHTAANANVRQILGRNGEVWGAESGLDRLVVMRTKP